MGAVALLLGIAAAALGTQCPAQGPRLGICPDTGGVLAARPTTAPASPPASRARPPDGPAATAAVPEPEPAPASASVAQEATATLSAHDLIEASHELLLAQAERPLLRGGFGGARDTMDEASPARAATPALDPAAAPDPTGMSAPPAPDQAMASVGGEPETVPPASALPDAAQRSADETLAVGGPLLPPLPEPEPLSLPTIGRDAGEAGEIDAASPPEPTIVRIGDSRVNVRAGPSTAAARLFGLDPGTEVIATEAGAGWQKVEDAAGRAGWVSAELLAGAGDAVAEPADATAAAGTVAPAAGAATLPEGAEKRTVAGAGVNVRASPANAGTRLFALPAGEEVTVTGSDKGWLQIVDSRGRTGWAYSDFLAPKP